jgi:RimJ/RimL family protein N-acetyltransferase
MILTPVILEGERVRLTPMSHAHLDDLFDAQSEDVWQYLPVVVRTRDDMRAVIDHCCQAAERGDGLAFAIIDKLAGRAVGATGYWNLDPPHPRVEIGFTWLGTSWQRTSLNTECKLLLMRHAFTVMGCERVELKTDARNQRSQAAIERLGATREGTLRKHMLTRDGFIRDSVYFSVIREEWPRVEAHLQQLLRRHGPDLGTSGPV